ncbi:hypothetical protein [Telluribacter sp.]|jgi:hypothetical protein|uniref:hypothetical protein n=1 Tax=Telluribacter sp. TaxID=1978767 RepID=UPI002E0E9EFE|nr:hypothetical protein [Telluribacter sp.]
MKKILHISFLLLVVGLSNQLCHAQSYQTGVGIRLGNTGGLSVKHFVDGRRAVEGILSTRWRSLGVTGLLEWHKEAFQTPGLNFYYGVGGHLYLGGYRRRYYERSSGIGIDGILGLEYQLRQSPISGSLDWKPAINLIGRGGYQEGGLALTVRYVF